MPKKTTGIFQRNGWWHIDKSIKGIGRIRGSCETQDRAEAEKRLNLEIERRRRALIYGEQVRHTFEEAAAKYVDEATHKSLDRDITSLNLLMPFIGHLDLLDVHDDTLAPFVAHRKALGRKSGTVKRDLAIVDTIMTLAARKWRDESGRTWIPQAPLITKPDWRDKRKPKPFTWQEQKKVLGLMPDNVVELSLYAVNTGIRSNVQRELRWAWEVNIPEIDASVFVVPPEYMKGDDSEENAHVIVHNRIAQNIIEARRGIHDVFVFSVGGKQYYEVPPSCWDRRRRAYDARQDELKRKGKRFDPLKLMSFRWHDWRHAFSKRLRAQGVSKETRQVLLGHKNGDITTDYSAAEIQELIDAVTTLENARETTMLRAI